jgi:hypothetical protein
VTAWRAWAPRCARPPAPHQQRSESTMDEMSGPRVDHEWTMEHWTPAACRDPPLHPSLVYITCCRVPPLHARIRTACVSRPSFCWGGVSCRRVRLRLGRAADSAAASPSRSRCESESQPHSAASPSRSRTRAPRACRGSLTSRARQCARHRVRVEALHRGQLPPPVVPAARHDSPRGIPRLPRSMMA